LITQSDDGQDFDPADPLTVILRPAPDYLGLPPGRYEKIRRGAARRRLLRAAVGIGLAGAVATLVVLPLRAAGPVSPASPAVPLGPPPASAPPAGATPSLTPTPAVKAPGSSPATTAKTGPTRHAPSRAPVTPRTRRPADVPQAATTAPTAASSAQSGGRKSDGRTSDDPTSDDRTLEEPQSNAPQSNAPQSDARTSSRPTRVSQ
jgi:hypothetical protein